jgi:hypothetical protein
MTVTTEPDYAWLNEVLGESGTRSINWQELELNREGALTALPRSLSSFGSSGLALTWNSGDANTTKWYPQGITSTSLATNPTIKRYLAASWYADGDYSHKGARVTFIDISSDGRCRYRHVLLVQNKTHLTGRPSRRPYNQLRFFGPVPVHAGGLEWLDNRLFVVDTRIGIRVFDLQRILPAAADPSKNRCGFDNGNIYGFNYGYVLPQVELVRMTDGDPYSCISVESARGEPQRFWTGQYQKWSPITVRRSARPRLCGWQLAPNHSIPNQTRISRYPRDEDGDAVFGIQGAFCDGETAWLSVTPTFPPWQRAGARLIIYHGDELRGYRRAWPRGAEDLHFEHSSGLLWCQTEFPGSRTIFGIERSLLT